MMRNLWVLTLGLMACGGDDAKEGEDTGTTTDGACANSILEEFPANGSADAFYRTTVEFSLATAEAGATIMVMDASGAEVAGTNSVVDARVIFTPSEPLMPSSPYNVTLNWECGPTNTSFTTSATGASVDAGGLPGSTYNLDLASGRFVEPAGVGDLLGTLLEFSLFVGITSADSSSLGMMGALSDDSGSAQDLCSETIAFPVDAAFGANPYFEIQSDSLPIEVEGFSINIDNLTLSGAFSPDASAVEGVVLAGGIDTRPLVDLVSPGGGEDAVCLLVQTFNVFCEECGDGSGPYCLSVYVDSLRATKVSGLTLVERTSDDIAQDPTCAE